MSMYDTTEECNIAAAEPERIESSVTKYRKKHMILLYLNTQSVHSQRLNQGPFSIYHKPETQLSNSKVKPKMCSH